MATILTTNGTLDHWFYKLNLDTSYQLPIYSITFGLCFTIFTWMITYMDSRIPGVMPPSPISPKKIRSQSGHQIHLNYVLALLNGIAISLILFYDF